MAIKAAVRIQRQQIVPEQQFYGEDFILIDHHNCHHDGQQQINTGNRNSFICRIIELEKTIFCLMFHLIETYYRPIINQLPLSNNKNSNKSTIDINRQLDRTTTGKEWYCEYRMPSKRIYGLQKAYKRQFDKKFDRAAILLSDNCYLQFHRNHIDWQLVFAPISGFPCCRQSNTTLAKQLDFDSLLDIEDAITQSAYLLANARQHSQLIDNLILNNAETNNGSNDIENDGKQPYRPSSQYELIMKDDYDDFTRLVKMIEKLVKIKSEQMKECLMISEHQNKPKESLGLLDAWLFFKRKSRSFDQTENEHCHEYDVSQVQNLIEDLRKEIASWEELIDVINILKCSPSLQ